MITMTKRKIANPFVYQGYVGPDYFCDRVVETEQLCSDLQNGRNVTLIAPRKIGKTGLIKNTFFKLKKENKEALFLYMDIFSTRNQHDFVTMFGNAVCESLMSHGQQLKRRALQLMGAWRPVFSLDPLTGAPTVSVTIEASQTSMSLKSIFDFLGSLKQEVYIAFDEFQQITIYPEQGTEALLRSYIQFAPNIHFIFSGSRMHLMSEMFGSPGRPFFQSTQFLSLKPLYEEVYYDFARGFFNKRKGELDRDVFQQLYQRFEGYTWYVQSVLNQLYENTSVVRSVEQLNEAIVMVLAGKEPQYETLLQFLTDNQRRLLLAIAHEDVVSQPTGKAFIQKYRLGSASSIRSTMEVLQDRDLIYRTSQGLIVYDRFLSLWLRRTFVL
mgnify:FL=1